MFFYIENYIGIMRSKRPCSWNAPLRPPSQDAEYLLKLDPPVEYICVSFAQKGKCRGRGRSSAVSDFFLILLGGKLGPICWF